MVFLQILLPHCNANEHLNKLFKGKLAIADITQRLSKGAGIVVSKLIKWDIGLVHKCMYSISLYFLIWVLSWKHKPSPLKDIRGNIRVLSAITVPRCFSHISKLPLDTHQAMNMRVGIGLCYIRARVGMMQRSCNLHNETGDWHEMTNEKHAAKIKYFFVVFWNCLKPFLTTHTPIHGLPKHSQLPHPQQLSWCNITLRLQSILHNALIWKIPE